MKKILLFFFFLIAAGKLSIAQVQLISGGVPNSYTLTFPGVFSYTKGIAITFKANFTNTGAASINVNGLGAKMLKKQVSNDLSAGDILNGQIVTVVYDSSNFQLVSAYNVTGAGAQLLSISNDTLSILGSNFVVLPVGNLMASDTVWALEGNTNPDADKFMGTNDAQPLLFKTFNTQRMKIRRDGVLDLSGNGNQTISIGKGNWLSSGLQRSIAIGDNALHATLPNVVSAEHTALGNSALYSLSGNSLGNTAIGFGAGYSLIAASNNTLIGYGAMSAATQGDFNVAVGLNAMSSNISGSYNTTVGVYAKTGSPNLTNSTAIGTAAITNCSNCLVLGDTNSVVFSGDTIQVGIGTTTPSALLDVVGSLRLNAGSSFANSVLTTTNGDGTATWQAPTIGADAQILQLSGATITILNSNSVVFPGGAPSDSAWSLNGNPNIDTTLQFIGTTNQMPLSFRINNEERMKLTTNGFLELYGINNNTGIGPGVFPMLTNGIENTALGWRGLENNTTGSHNTSIGYNALVVNTTGSFNKAVGSNALIRNTTGSYNVAVGYNSLGRNVNANDNTAVGYIAAQFSTAHSNTAMGNNSLPSLNDGIYNTALGTNALNQQTFGSRGTGIGAQSRPSTTSLNNVSAIGFGAIVNDSNSIRVGNTSITSIQGQVAFSSPSDARFKFNVTDTDVPGLNFILQLRPVNYNFNNQAYEDFVYREIPDSIRVLHTRKNLSRLKASRETGFIAQEVEQAAIKANYNFGAALHIPKSKNDYYALAYSHFVVPLVKAVQELNQKIESFRGDENPVITGQQKEVNALKTQNSTTQTQLDEMKKQLDEMKRLLGKK